MNPSDDEILILVPIHNWNALTKETRNALETYALKIERSNLGISYLIGRSRLPEIESLMAHEVHLALL